jgi:hypothetical protein
MLYRCPHCHRPMMCRRRGWELVYHCPTCVAIGIPTQEGRDYGDETRPAPPDYPECERVKQQPHLAMEMDAIARRIVREALGG